MNPSRDAAARLSASSNASLRILAILKREQFLHRPLHFPPIMAEILATPTKYKKIAQSLPGILRRFFEKFPPGQPYALETQRPSKPVPTTSTLEDGTVAAIEPTPEDLLRVSTPFSDPTYNPFLPWRNPITGRWRGPYYGLRRQANLCKAAERYGMETMMPWSMKASAVKLERRETRGLRVKGTGEGDKVKGKAWERSSKGRLQERKKAMIEMPKLVQGWKEVSRSLVMEIMATIANSLIERTRPRLEEVAEMNDSSPGRVLNILWTGIIEHRKGRCSHGSNCIASLALCGYICTLSSTWKYGGTNVSILVSLNSVPAAPRETVQRQLAISPRQIHALYPDQYAQCQFTRLRIARTAI